MPRKRKPPKAALDLAEFAGRQIRTNMSMLAEIRAVRAMLCKLAAQLLTDKEPDHPDRSKLELELADEIDAKITSFMNRLQQSFYEQAEDIDAGLAALLDDRKPEDIEPEP